MIERQVARRQRERFANTIQFLEAVIAEGAHQTVPEYLTEDQWQDKLDATLTYLLSPPDISLEKTGNIYNQGREWTRTARNSTARILYKRALPSTQEFFGPFKMLELNKPRPPKKPKENILFLNGQEPKSSYQKNKELINNLKKAKTDQEKQELLNLVPRGLYQKHVKGTDSLFVPVKKLVAGAGFHISSPKNFAIFRKTIVSSGVPMGEIRFKASKEKTYTYYFILTQDQKRAKEALFKNEDLKPFFRHPVSQVAGPAQKELPLTTYIMSEDFKTIGGLLWELGVPLGKLTKQYRNLLLPQPDLPVPIYYYDGRYLYSIKDQDQLRSYTKQFLERVLTAA